MELRGYQQEALDSVVKDYDAGARKVLIQSATGTGKTLIFAALYERMKSRLPGQMLVLSHTEELVTQNLAKLQAMNPTAKVGKEMAGSFADPNCDIISACVATTGRQGTKRNDRFNWENISIVIIDEAHHSPADAYRRVIDLVGVNASGSDKLLLGVTATSQRPDGKALSDIYERISYVYSMRQAIKDGWLVPVRGYRISTDTSLSDVGKSNGDFVKSELSRAVNTPSRNRQIVSSWLKLGGDRQTVAFTVDIEHAEKLAEEFRNEGVTAEAIWGDDPKREEKLEAHRAGKIRVLCNCNVLVEGYDDPSISCIILARPTASGVLYVQMVGRGTRLSPATGKQNLIVIDVVDATIGHSLMTLPTLMGLQNILDLKGRDMVEVAEEIEALQEEHPGIDWTTLKDVDELKTLVQQIDMFEIRFPKEVEENSELIWFRAIDGGFKIIVPKDGPEKTGFMHVFENQLGQWECVGRIKDVSLRGIRPTLEEAFKAADEQIRKRLSKMVLSYILRQATWHGKKVTDGQRKMITRLFPHRAFPFEQMTAGMASKIISERLNKKGK